MSEALRLHRTGWPRRRPSAGSTAPRPHRKLRRRRQPIPPLPSPVPVWSSLPLPSQSSHGHEAYPGPRFQAHSAGRSQRMLPINEADRSRSLPFSKSAPSPSSIPVLGRSGPFTSPSRLESPGWSGPHDRGIRVAVPGHLGGVIDPRAMPASGRPAAFRPAWLGISIVNVRAVGPRRRRGSSVLVLRPQT